jgi:hypothetical protein
MLKLMETDLAKQIDSLANKPHVNLDNLESMFENVVDRFESILDNKLKNFAATLPGDTGVGGGGRGGSGGEHMMAEGGDVRKGDFPKGSHSWTSANSAGKPMHKQASAAGPTRSEAAEVRGKLLRSPHAHSTRSISKSAGLVLEEGHPMTWHRPHVEAVFADAG